MHKISVIVPCYNVERYIHQCLESIVNQTHSNLEIICIDDGSTDNTPAIIDRVALTDTRIKVIHKSNTGYGDTMNVGLEASTGDYIGIVESDDWIEPDMYETLLRAALDNSLDIARCLWLESRQGKEKEKHFAYAPIDEVFSPLESQGVFRIQTSIWAALYRRELLDQRDKIRFLPTPGASFQDTSFSFKAYSKARRVMIIPRPLLHYRINESSSVASSGKVECILDEWREIGNWIDSHEEIKQHLCQTPLMSRYIYGGFIWNFNRLNDVASRKFLDAASPFLRDLVNREILQTTLFEKISCGSKLYNVIFNPDKYYQQQMSHRKRKKLLKKIFTFCKA